MELALIGAGAMGSAIGARLLDCGHSLRVFDPDATAAARIKPLGATVYENAAQASCGAQMVILSLNHAHIVTQAVFGDAGVSEGIVSSNSGLRPVVVDMSSIDPVSTAKLAQTAAELNIGWVDSPLSGGIPKAEVGALTLMVGGAEVDVERARTVLVDLASNITHMGAAGAGQATKLVNQLLCGLGFLAVAEATELALKSGIDAAMVPKALAGGRADSALLQEYMPRYVQNDLRRTGRIDNMVKDLKAVVALAEQSDADLPLTSLCLDLHQKLVSMGLGGEDQAAAMSLFSPVP